MKLTLTAILALFVMASMHAQAPTPSPTPTPPDYVAQLSVSGRVQFVPSPTAIANQTVTVVPRLTAQLFQTIKAFATALWANPATAQATVDSLGAKAAPLFIAYGEFAGPLSVIDPVTYATLPPVPAGYSWTILPAQADGTWPAGQRSVTINAPSPSPSPTPSPTPTPAP